MLQTPVKRTRERSRPKQTTPVRIVSASATGSVLTLVFDQPVTLKGVPQYTTDIAGADPTSAVLRTGFLSTQARAIWVSGTPFGSATSALIRLTTSTFVPRFFPFSSGCPKKMPPPRQSIA